MVNSYSTANKEDYNPLKTQPVKIRDSKSSETDRKHTCLKPRPPKSNGGTQNIASLLQAIKKNENEKLHDTKVIATMVKHTPEKSNKSRNGMQAPAHTAKLVISNFMNANGWNANTTTHKPYDNDIKSKILSSYNSNKLPTNASSKQLINSRHTQSRAGQKDHSHKPTKIDFNQTALMKSYIKR
jgi:hypothetical protein